jgi:serine/threonine protein kinase
MIMDTCLSKQELARFASGDMESEARARVSEHIGECPACKAAYEFLLIDHHFLQGKKSGVASRPLDETSAIATNVSSAMDETVSHASGESTSHRPSTGPVERFPQIEGYHVKRILGRGGMGVVYEAIQVKLNRRVALKLLPAVVSTAHPEFITRFRREATAAAKLHHTNIIPVYDYGESPHGYYYAMELIDGLPLSALTRRLAAINAPSASHTAIAALLQESDPGINNRPLTGDATNSDPSATGTGGSTGTKGRPYYRQIAHWFASVAEALHYAHAHGMIHRDIKPSNLMLCTDGRMMVLDFGLVKDVTDQSMTATGSLVGTYRYMSPEQVGAKRVAVDARTDVYSLGATLYECLAFQPAFASTDQTELLSQILFKDPTPPRKTVPTVPIDLQTICLKALEKNPGGRYHSAREMANDLNLYLGDMPIVARPQGPLQRAFKLVRRRRMESIAVAAGVLLIGAITIGGFVYGKLQTELRAKLMVAGNQYWQEDQNWDAAEKCFVEVLSGRPSHEQALINLANMFKDKYNDTGDEEALQSAEKWLDRGIEANPDSVHARNARGVLKMTMGKLGEARDDFEEIGKIKPKYFPALVNLATVHAMDGDLAAAERCASRGAELADEERPKMHASVATSDAVYIMPWRVLGAIQLQADHDEALETLTTACERSGNQNPPSLLLLAQWHLRQGTEDDRDEALKLIVTADKMIEPRSETDRLSESISQDIWRCRQFFARLYLDEQNWKRAVKEADAAIEAGDETGFSSLILAVAKGHLGDAAAARDYLDRATEEWREAARLATSGETETADGLYRATQDGPTLWFDSASEYIALYHEAVRILEPLEAGN